MQPIFRSRWIFPFDFIGLRRSLLSISYHLVIITPPLQLTDPQIHPYCFFALLLVAIPFSTWRDPCDRGGAPCQMFPWNLKEKLHRGQKFGNFCKESLAFCDNMGLCCYSKFMHIFLFQSKAIRSLLDFDKLCTMPHVKISHAAIILSSVYIWLLSYILVLTWNISEHNVGQRSIDYSGSERT